MIINYSEEYLKWFDRLKDKIARATIIKRLAMIEDMNHLGDSKLVDKNIFELRIHYGPGYRIYFTVRGKEVIILLCGGDKSTQETDIEKAKRIEKEV